jgi:hypothetical protein
MKWLRKKHKRKDVGELDPRVIRVLLKFRAGLNTIAERLQIKMNRYSFRMQKILLAGFCFVFVSASTYVAVASLGKRSYGYCPQSISLVPLPEEKAVKTQLLQKELARIHRFKLYIDSLPACERKVLFDNRPHLMDTVNFLESLYQQEIKTK